jgi:hypothetical protein
MPLRDSQEQKGRGAKWDELQGHGGVTSSWSNGQPSSVPSWLAWWDGVTDATVCWVPGRSACGLRVGSAPRLACRTRLPQHQARRLLQERRIIDAQNAPKGSGLHRPFTGETNHSRFLPARATAPIPGSPARTRFGSRMRSHWPDPCLSCADLGDQSSLPGLCPMFAWSSTVASYMWT